MGTAVYETIKESRNLPSPTGVTLEILRLANDPNATTKQFSAVIGTDPALAARVLHLVNSPFAGLPRQIASITRAVGFLGQRTVTGLALSFSLVSENKKGPCKDFDYATFWSDSLARAVAAKHMVRRVGGFEPDEVFTCSLLGQIGRLAFATAFPDTYTAAIENVTTHDGAALAEAELRVFGIDHPRLASELMGDWHIPDLFREAVLLQYTPDDNRGDANPRAAKLAKILYVSGLIAHVFTEEAVDPAMLAILSNAAEAFDMTPDELNETIDVIWTDWCETGRAFLVETRDVPPAADVYAQAAELRGEEGTPKLDEDADDNQDCVLTTESIRVLVVDPDPDVRALLATYLDGEGYEVVQAADGEGALRHMLIDGPPIVITGLETPGIDGLELCRKIRTHPGIAYTYVILSTARNVSEEKIVEALDAGADNVLTKPFRRNELLARLRAARRIAKLQLDLDVGRRQLHRYNAEMEIAVAKLASANSDLERMATTDELTGLVNRREALNRLSKDWAYAERKGTPLSVVVLDIDHFKVCNDTYGHAAGDAVLKGTAQALNHSARLEETVCRIGGEEFLVLCPQTTEAQAAACAERIRKAIEAHVVRYRGLSLRVTVSLGVAQRQAHTENADDLLRDADKALYAAKDAGRNSVALATQCGSADSPTSIDATVAKPKANVVARSSK